jgi:Domain of unknown function (DUF4384)
MDPVEYDVYVSYREPSGADLARQVSEGLARRGFRLFPLRGAASGGAVPPIVEIPDFVLLLTPTCLEACADENDPMRAEIAEALRTERNVVPVAVRGYEHPPTLPPDIAAVRQRPTVPFSATRATESVARIAHRLSSDATVDERHLMRDARRIFTAVGLLLLVLAAIAAVRTLPGMLTRYLGSRPLAPMTLYWSAFAERATPDRWVEVTVKDGSPMLAGDQFRLAFAVTGAGRAYVVGKDLRGQISVLFPRRGIKNASLVTAGQVYSAPGDGTWWAPDEGVGVDRIYVFASYDSIENLESLMDEREESPAERRALLDSTVEGLLDGKHGAEPLRIRTRSGRPVLRSLQAPPMLLTAPVTLAGGTRVTHTLTEERGLLSAMVEISVGHHEQSAARRP